MTILNRYLTLEILKLSAIILAMVIGIYLIVDFFEKVDDFIEKGVPLVRSLVFLTYKIPFILAQILPVCFLLAILVVFGLMNKNNEIIALKSSGMSVYGLFKPVLVLGVLFSVVLFSLSEVAVPITMAKSNAIWLREVKKQPAMLSREKNIWMKGDHSIAHIKYYHAAKKTLFGFSLNRFDPAFRLTQRIDAEKGEFINGRWVLHQVLEQNFGRQPGAGRMTFHETMAVDLAFSPEDLSRVVKKSEEMNYNELKEFIDKVEAEGYEATTYRVDLYAKIAFPLVCIIMSLLGTGVALKGKLREGLPVAIAYGIGIAFLYWIFYSFCVSLGYGKMLPTMAAPWVANLVFLSFGLYLLLSAE